MDEVRVDQGKKGHQKKKLFGHFTSLKETEQIFPLIFLLGFNFHPRLFLPRPGSEDDVHVRLRNGRSGLQQGAD